MKKKNPLLRFVIFIVILLVMLSEISYGQQNKKQQTVKKPFKERIFIGGSLGLSFGSNSSFVEVSPVFGYALTEKLIVGVGLTYKYYRYKDYYALTYTDSTGTYITGWDDFETNMYGGSIWARYFLTGIGIPIVENIFLHGEIEPLIFDHNYVPDPYGDYYDGFQWYSKGHQTVTLSGIFLGGGLQQPIGGRSYMYLEILWNFNEELYSPYNNPRVRIGVAVGL